MRGIIDLAHSLGLIVTAEGIDSEEQMALLKDMGCDRIQGYLISKPLAVAAVPAAYQSTMLRRMLQQDRQATETNVAGAALHH
ncbi:EAL domain-containing protein [Rhizobium sp. ARZ01]|nr:EAL domain-containing protein [Rhizobium sp. ARZ01]